MNKALYLSTIHVINLWINNLQWLQEWHATVVCNVGKRGKTFYASTQSAILLASFSVTLVFFPFWNNVSYQETKKKKKQYPVVLRHIWHTINAIFFNRSKLIFDKKNKYKTCSKISKMYLEIRYNIREEFL